jgi:hypothetical protein
MTLSRPELPVGWNSFAVILYWGFLASLSRVNRERRVGLRLLVPTLLGKPAFCRNYLTCFTVATLSLSSTVRQSSEVPCKWSSPKSSPALFVCPNEIPAHELWPVLSQATSNLSYRYQNGEKANRGDKSILWRDLLLLASQPHQDLQAARAFGNNCHDAAVRLIYLYNLASCYEPLRAPFAAP